MSCPRVSKILYTAEPFGSPGRASVRNVSFEYEIEVNSKSRLFSVEGVPVEKQRLLCVLFRVVPAVDSRM
jgi:hypothetical protein